jgi:hypothetical protein
MHISETDFIFEHDSWTLPPNLYAKGTARGLYNPMQFVVRLHPKLQADLAAIVDGVYTANQLKPEVILAYSTYIHETIHWWQHIGSTSGLIMSLCFPAQAHVNFTRLKTLLNKIGPKKPLRRFHLDNSGKVSDEVETILNLVLNNWHDIEFCRWLAINPHSVQEIVTNPYFDSIGHSYDVTLTACIWLLSQIGDPKFKVLPNPQTWEKAFTGLRNRKVAGYYFGSPIYLPPLGARAIFEGQARFSQLQYLYFASGGSLSWQDFQQLGMLEGVYVEAFSLFLKLLDEHPPASIDHPLVALFLLVCELSINPTEGLPFDILHFESFVPSVDPGMRFYLLTQAIQRKHVSLKMAITKYSKERYIEASEILSRELVCPPPLVAAERVASWPQQTDGFRQLIEEDIAFRFAPENLPVRLFVSRFINFQKDKLEYPEFFTWPGVWFNERGEDGLSLDQTRAIFNRNEAPFLDAPDGEVRPRLIEGRSESDIYDTFNQFYAWNANYAMIRQWHIEDGPFNLDFNWLTTRWTQEEMLSWAKNIFKDNFGVGPDDFTIL